MSLKGDIEHDNSRRKAKNSTEKQDFLDQAAISMMGLAMQHPDGEGLSLDENAYYSAEEVYDHAEIMLEVREQRYFSGNE